MTKYLMIIGDGMADAPVRALDGRTPLQAALTPTLDKLAGQRIGSARSIPDGQSAGTETAIPILMGYGVEVLTGRGPVEAAGLGVAMQPGQWAMRLNLVTFNDNDKLLNACPELTSQQALAAADALLADKRFAALLAEHDVVLHRQDTFRQLLIGNHAPPSSLPTPPHNVIGASLAKSLPSDAFVKALMTLGRAVLRDLPDANGVWPWGCGVMPQYEIFASRFGKSGACVTAVPMVSGLARLCGLDVIDVPGATGTLHTHWRAKAAATVRAFDDHDFVLLHIEAPDDCSHAMNLADKLAAIELVDAAAAAVLDGMADKHLRVLLCSDHYTCVETGQHAADPTPYSIWDSAGSPAAGQFREQQGTVVDGATPLSQLMEVQP